MEKLKPKINLYLEPTYGAKEEKMESQKLCKDCMEELKKKYHFEDPIPKSAHCHHPEPEKPPCKWCGKFRDLKLTYHGTPFWETLSYLILCTEEKMIDKCPICGGTL